MKEITRGKLGTEARRVVSNEKLVIAIMEKLFVLAFNFDRKFKVRFFFLSFNNVKFRVHSIIGSSVLSLLGNPSRLFFVQWVKLQA